MNNRKATKRALLTSVMALVMCVVMLVGTTFAWFTDTATANVNKIQAGKLDVDMVDETGASLVGRTLSWQKAAGGADQEILWEPGATYNLNAFRIVNKGNLALKYEITVNGVKGSSKLLEAIDFTAKIGNDKVTLDNLTGVLLPKGATAQTADGVVEKTDLITISGTMKTGAGNEYQGLTIDGVSITVVATQYTYEYDSNGKTYDGTADATIQVNKDNIQDYLDGKYGSIDGMTLVLAAGDYGQLELGRATKYAGSNTEYMVGGFTSDAEHYQKFDTAEDLIAYKSASTWTPTCFYRRSMNNVTLKAAEGADVSIEKVVANAGQIYGTSTDPRYDWVLGIEVPDTNKSYYMALNWNNITFVGLKFKSSVNIESSSAETNVNGVHFNNCEFKSGYAALAAANDANAKTNGMGIRFVSWTTTTNNLKNLTVDKCIFKDCCEGVYTNPAYGVSVTDNNFENINHNAVAIQDTQSPAVDHGQVVIAGNTFTNIGDRIIRFNNVGADTQITIKNNTATNSGDDDGEVIKATRLAAGIKYNISDNDWGDNTKVANPEFADKVTP